MKQKKMINLISIFVVFLLTLCNSTFSQESIKLAHNNTFEINNKGDSYLFTDVTQNKIVSNNNITFGILNITNGKDTKTPTKNKYTVATNSLVDTSLADTIIEYKKTETGFKERINISNIKYKDDITVQYSLKTNAEIKKVGSEIWFLNNHIAFGRFLQPYAENENNDKIYLEYVLSGEYIYLTIPKTFVSISNFISIDPTYDDFSGSLNVNVADGASATGNYTTRWYYSMTSASYNAAQGVSDLIIANSNLTLDSYANQGCSGGCGTGSGSTILYNNATTLNITQYPLVNIVGISSTGSVSGNCVSNQGNAYIYFAGTTIWSNGVSDSHLGTKSFSESPFNLTIKTLNGTHSNYTYTNNSGDVASKSGIFARTSDVMYFKTDANSGCINSGAHGDAYLYVDKVDYNLLPPPHISLFGTLKRIILRGTNHLRIFG